MVENKAVKLQTVWDRECLSLPKKEEKDSDNRINNRTKSDLEIFQLQLDKLSLYEQFSSFKQSL